MSNCAKTNILTNGNFTEPQLENNTFKYFKGMEVPGWQFNDIALMNNSSAWGYPKYPCGNQAISIQTTGWLSQKFNVSNPGIYELLIFYCGRNCCDNSKKGNTIEIYFNNKNVGNIIEPPVNIWNMQKISLEINNLTDNELLLRGIWNLADRSTGIQLALYPLIYKNVSNYDSNAVGVFVSGNYGIGPWGSEKKFPDQTAQWIWSCMKSNKGSDASSNPIKFQYIYKNNTLDNIEAILNVIVDDKSTIKLNGQELKNKSADKDKNIFKGGWDKKDNWPQAEILLVPGDNLLEFEAQSKKGVAGLLASAIIKKTNSILFHTDNNWKFIPIDPTPIDTCKLSIEGLIISNKYFPWGCLTLNGTKSQYLDLGILTTGMNGISFGLWFKSNSNSIENSLFSLSNNSNDLISIYFGQNGVLKACVNLFDNKESQIEITSSNLNNSEWYHLVWTIERNIDGNGALWNFYISNQLVKSISGNYPTNITRTNCYIGMGNLNNSNMFNGEIANFVMCQKTLNVEEIKKLYNGYINLNEPKLYIYLPLSTNSVLDTIVNNYKGKKFTLPTVKSENKSLNWNCLQENNKWMPVKLTSTNSTQCMSLDGKNCQVFDEQSLCEKRADNPITPEIPVTCTGTNSYSWCKYATALLDDLKPKSSNANSNINSNGEIKQENLSESTQMLTQLSSLQISSEGESITLKPTKEGKILSLKNMDQVENLMIGGVFKLRVNVPMMPPYIKGQSFDTSKGTNPNYFYLCVEKLDDNCSYISSSGRCVNVYADNKKCSSKSLINRVQQSNSFRLVLIASDYVLEKSIPFGKNSDFTLVKINGQLYLKNIQTGLIPSLFSNQDTKIIFGDMNINSNTNIIKIQQEMNNVLCGQQPPIYPTSGTQFVRCLIEEDPSPNLYLMTSNNIGTSTPIKINIKKDSSINLNLLKFNSFGYPTNSYSLTMCNFNVKTFDYIEKITNSLGTFFINLVCFAETTDKVKNELDFIVELKSFPPDFIKKNSLHNI